MERRRTRALATMTICMAVVGLAHSRAPGRAEPTPAPRPRPAPRATAARALRDGERLDLNRADAASLELLPGIGPALAARIVRYRRAHGAFREPRELIGVRGIGERRLQALEGLVEVRAPSGSEGGAMPRGSTTRGASTSTDAQTLAPDGGGG